MRAAEIQQDKNAFCLNPLDSRFRGNDVVEYFMPRIQSFPPIENPAATILILGSMPGKESLRAGQYYSHLRNAFWPIMGELTGATPELAYAKRIRKLKSASRHSFPGIHTSRMFSSTAAWLNNVSTSMCCLCSKIEFCTISACLQPAPLMRLCDRHRALGCARLMHAAQQHGCRYRRRFDLP